MYTFNQTTIEYLNTFVTSGLTITLVSYIASFADPVLAAILWTFPVSILFPMYYMKKHNKTNDEIAYFAISTLFTLLLLVIILFSFYYFISRSKNGIFIPIAKSSVVWLISSIFFYIFTHNIDVKHYFI
jgi:fumarate reductase subunit D